MFAETLHENAYGTYWVWLEALLHIPQTLQIRISTN